MTFRARFANYVRQHHLALIALFFSLGLGTAWAATELPADSVGTQQIRHGGVTKQDIRADAVGRGEILEGGVGTREVKNHSLLCEDFAQRSVCDAAARGPEGPTGATGATGPTGPAGASISPTLRIKTEILDLVGPQCTTTEDQGSFEMSCTWPRQALFIHCEEGEQATGGSVGSFPNGPEVVIHHDNPRPHVETGVPFGWDGVVSATYESGPQTSPPSETPPARVRFWVVCLS